ncbi:MAG: trypsin-like serine protease [Terrimicrobiaceae bacterium]|nr:trypsin-like serine protease [Terrimicrobiaceae bacterium]
MRGIIRPIALLIATLFALCFRPALAVQTSGGYVTTEPTDSDVANWTTGWGATGITGWDYVGNVNGPSGVYIGNGWVMTAGHVGPGDFTLAGIIYSYVGGSERSISNAKGTADLILFQIATAPALPPLTISSSSPSVASYFVSGSTVVMIGYGGGQGETWGANTVTAKNVSVTVSGYSYVTTDFKTAYGTTTYTNGLGDSRSITNNATLVGGDSGGGGFIYNSATARWQLAGINEAVDLTSSDSYLVQLSTYASQINGLTAVPEAGLAGLVGAAGLLLPILARLRRRRAQTPRER